MSPVVENDLTPAQLEQATSIATALGCEFVEIGMPGAPMISFYKRDVPVAIALALENGGLAVSLGVANNNFVEDDYDSGTLIWVEADYHTRLDFRRAALVRFPVLRDGGAK